MVKRGQALGFVMDGLTNSIRNVVTGDSFPTDVCRLTNADLPQVTKKNGWNFNWRTELADNTKTVYKLTIVNNPTIVQGMMSLSVKSDHVYIELIENAPFNIGQAKVYEGVPGNLVAYACKVAFQQGFEGAVSFRAKTRLIAHYENTLGAVHFGNHLMVILPNVAQHLVDTYFKN